MNTFEKKIAVGSALAIIGGGLIATGAGVIWGQGGALIAAGVYCAIAAISIWPGDK